jgi:hypothetical protein
MTAQVDCGGYHPPTATAVTERPQRERVERGLDGDREQQRGDVAVHLRPAAEIAGLTLVALVLATRVPLLASVVGLMVFGILHNVLELRYVVRRCRATLARWFLPSVLGVVTVIAFARLLGPMTGARRTELVAGFAILALGIVRGARERPVLAGVLLPLVAATGLVAWRHLDLYFVAVTYLHNLVPFVFLEDWARRHLAPGRARRAFRAAQAGWLVVVPSLLLSGVVPVAGLAGQAGDATFAGPFAAHVNQAAPAAWRAEPGGARLLALFAFLQVMHYGFWCWFLPRRADPQELRPARSDRVATTAVAVAAGVFVAGFVTAWMTTKTAYVSVASYHAYLEYAILAALLPGLLTRRKAAS